MERGWRSGPRLPTTAPAETPVGCWHCGDEANQLRRDGSRIRLFPVGLSWRDGRRLARVRVCDTCLAALTPRPDPLDVSGAI